MKKKLLLFAIVALGITLVAAQSIKVVASQKSKATSAKVIEMPKSPMSKTAAIHSAVQKQGLFQKDLKVRSSISKGNSVLKVLQARNGAVMKSISLLNQTKLSRKKSISPLLRLKATADTTYFESFEGYDGEASDWIPSDWAELNKTGNTFTSTDTIANPTWSVSTGGFTSATDGDYTAWINFEANGKAQDEWLISPAFIPKTEDYLTFDLYYSPLFMYLDYPAYLQTGEYSFDFTKVTATMQAYVSEDNGANWTKVWDANDYANQYNEDNIWDYMGDWSTFKVSMAQYVGKSIKVAFCYVGKNGDSMGLDNISVRSLAPVASYARPQGYFFAAFTPDYNGAAADLLFGHAYDSAIWQNTSNGDSQSFLWTFPDKQIENATFTSTDEHPEVVYPSGFYNIPSLKATAGNIDSTYSWGTSTSGVYFITGGQPKFSFGTLGVGNFDQTIGFQNPYFGENDYCFGTSPDSTVDAIANYFEKPVHRYILDSVWINVGKFSAPAGTEFKLIIRRVVDGTLADTISTSVCTAESVIQPITGYFTMMFKGFTSIDPETGLDVTADYLEIDDAIFVELSGFNKPNVSLSAFCQVIDDANTESNAYLYYKTKKTDGTISRKLLNSSDYVGPTSLLFNLGATYAHLLADDNKFVAPVEGGQKTFNVNSYYSPDAWWLDSELPSWLTSEQTFNETTWAITYTLKAEALPTGVTGRGTTVKVSTFGADMSFDVTQGDYNTDVKDVVTSKSKVINTNNSFELTYPSQFNRVTLVNISGQVIESFNLPTSGKYSISTNHLSRGIYFLRFTGANTENIKVIR